MEEKELFVTNHDVAMSTSAELAPLAVKTEIESSYVYTPGSTLTSTLWNQSGTIYISVNGKQQALSGYTYNKFCPNISASNAEKSVTGCSNTADSQLLYYWLERGYDLDLSVNTNDFFYTASTQAQHYVSDSPALGEGSMSVINNLLASPNLNSGDFIAALNYYCGVKNHSSYADSTGTSWLPSSYYNGTNANAYVAAGFDSYFFINSSGNNAASELFFNSSGLNDVGFSVVRENLDYGEAIRVGVPGHAIYMDGYRYNSSTGGYEYHLNYGWGMAASTKWYTVSELEELQLTYILIDLSPDICVNVTNDKNTYYGGSFLRGMERINHIRNDKATTFSFAEDLADKTIALTESASFTSSVDVAFKNFNVNFQTTDTDGFVSDDSMSFEMTDGSIMTYSKYADTAITLTANTGKTENLLLSLDMSWIYSGYHSSGQDYILANLECDNGYNYQTLDSSLLQSATGFAVSAAGNSSDVISLTNSSAIFGKVDLGGGSNTVTIESGSLLYGGISGQANSVTVNMEINNSLTGPMIVIADSSLESYFCEASGNQLNVDVAADAAFQTYTLYTGCSSTKIKNFTVNVTYGDTSFSLNSSNLQEEGFALIYDGTSIQLLHGGNTPPRAPAAMADITALTNKDVTVTATFSSACLVKEYSFDNKTWYSYSSGIKFTANGTVYFRGINAAGIASEVTSYTVSNIDKAAPEKPAASADITSLTNKEVTVTAAFSSDSTKKEYSFDNQTWSAYTTGIKFTANGTVYFRGTDAAGNISQITSYTVSNIDKMFPEKPVVTADITKPTNKEVTLTAVFCGSSVKKEYSLDNKTWLEFTGSVTLTQNGTVFFRGVNAWGRTSDVVQYTVDNIDLAAPRKPVASADITKPTNSDVTVAAIFSADTAQKEYSFDNKSWFSYSSGVKFSQNGTVYFRGTDAAGNISDVTCYTVSNIDKTTPGMPQAYADTTENTLNCVTVFATFSNDSVLKEYSLDKKTWQSYNSGVTLNTNGSVYFRGIDAAGNTSKTVTYTVSNIIAAELQNLKVSDNHLSWSKNVLAESYTVEFSKDNLPGILQIKTVNNQVDLLAMEQTLQWQVKITGQSQTVQGAPITGTADKQAQKLTSYSNGVTDIFFANAKGKWTSEYAAQHAGFLNGWEGTDEWVKLTGKNKLADIFEGSTDANILLMSDDTNGDALFIDDIYTALPGTVAKQQARISQIDEIRAGAGDDIVDMTSRRFEYIGNGVKLYGGLGDDTIWSNNGNNMLFGDAGNDRLVGGANNDVIVGGSGNDSMHGGGGEDIFCFGGDWGQDTVEQLANCNITLWFESGSGSNWNASTLTYTDGKNSVKVSGVSADDITLIFGNDSTLRYNELSASGCFKDAVSEKIFEDKNKGMLA